MDRAVGSNEINDIDSVFAFIKPNFKSATVASYRHVADLDTWLEAQHVGLVGPVVRQRFA
ncbi:hypothetical protein D3C71_1729370 [compost metagenome]